MKQVKPIHKKKFFQIDLEHIQLFQFLLALYFQITELYKASYGKTYFYHLWQWIINDRFFDDFRE